MAPSAQLERRIVWDTRQSNRFVVGGGTQISLYEWNQGQELIRHVASQIDLQHMRCFSWSPDPAFEDLFAVGNSTGRIDLLRLQQHPQPTSPSSTLSSSLIVPLPARTSRACNALAFSDVSPNYLAVGLEKVRGDSSLVIWDVSTATSKLHLPSLLPNDTLTVTLEHTPRAHRPLPKTVSEAGGLRLDPRIIQQHAPTESVSCLSFLPGTNDSLLAAISQRWLRLLDLRESHKAPGNVAAKVQGITVDPFDNHRIACFGDSTISVWDTRKFVHPLLTFTERDASADGAGTISHLSGARTPTLPVSYTSLEFSSTRRGMLASMEKDAHHVRLWNTTDAFTSNVSQSQMAGESDGGFSRESSATRGSPAPSSQAQHHPPQPKRSWANLPWSATMPAPSTSGRGSSSTRETAEGPAYTTILYNTHKTKSFHRPLASFALVPNINPSVSTSLTQPLTTNIMVVNREGDLELFAVHDAPKTSIWGRQGDLAITAGQSARVLYALDLTAERGEDKIPEPWEVQGQLGVGGGGSSVGATLSREGSNLGSSKERDRDRRRDVASPVLFGRGDEDGFPALASMSRRKSPVERPSSHAGGPWKSTGSALSVERPSSRLGTGGGKQRGGTSPGISPSRKSTLDTGAVVHQQDRGRPKKRKSHSVKDARQQELKGLSGLLRDDVSMVMWTRTIRGYSVGDYNHNANIMREKGTSNHDMSPMLSDVWAWLNHSRDYLCLPTSKINGYDFAFEGVWGIWEGLTPTSLLSGGPTAQVSPASSGASHPSELLQPISSTVSSGAGGNRPRKQGSHSSTPRDPFFMALQTLMAQRRLDKIRWKPAVKTERLLQRQVCMQLCGWPMQEEELAGRISSWEKDGQWSRAACWLTFTRQYSKASELLLRSNDEVHHMMSGTLIALSAMHSSSGSRSNELRDHCERLIVKMQDPYFRSMLTYLSMGDWSDVLVEEELLPFRERLAIALMFLDDQSLGSFLRGCMEHSKNKGDIDGLFVSGLGTKAGMDIIQGYLDRTGDVQTAAILASLVCPWKVPLLPAYERWIEAYRDLLDGFKLYHFRVAFDVDRGQILQSAVQNGDFEAQDAVGLTPKPQVLIRCNYCNKTVNPPPSLDASTGLTTASKPTVCPNCNRFLPRCAVCLLTLSLIPQRAEVPDTDFLEDAIIICQTCRHGGHSAHILDWFYDVADDIDGLAHETCPVADCHCRCADVM